MVPALILNDKVKACAGDCFRESLIRRSEVEDGPTKQRLPFKKCHKCEERAPDMQVSQGQAGQDLGM